MVIMPAYPKGDLRRMLAVLGAIDAGHDTLVQIASVTGIDKRSVTHLIGQAADQARVKITKVGPTYLINGWGPFLRQDGAKKALQGALNAPTISD